MKTPEEIKKWLTGCTDKSYCQSCYNEWVCKENADALAYIQQLEAELEAVKRERDAAVKDLWCTSDCFNCKYRDNQINCDGTGCCYSCELDCPCAKYPCAYEWRGVCPENTEVQDGQSDA